MLIYIQVETLCFIYKNYSERKKDVKINVLNQLEVNKVKLKYNIYNKKCVKDALIFTVETYNSN